jgi:putative sterol carrier protein
MAIEFATEKWYEEWCGKLNNHDQYGDQAAGWGVDFNGDFVMVYKADDRLPEDKYFHVQLEDGECRGVQEIDDPDDVDAGYKYKGEYTNWVRVNEGEVGPMAAMNAGLFDIEGDMQKIMEYAESSSALSEVGQEIDTEYPY